MSLYWETDEPMGIAEFKGLSGRNVWHASKEQQKSKYMNSSQVSVHVGLYIFECFIWFQECHEEIVIKYMSI